MCLLSSAVWSVLTQPAHAELECLRHLRELKADGNKITSLDGLQRMDGLVKLSVQGNRIEAVDLAQYRWCASSPPPSIRCVLIL